MGDNRDCQREHLSRKRCRIVCAGALEFCTDESTYASCGTIVNVASFEPRVTLEISNTTPLPARIYAGEGICQFLFFKSDQVCEVSYADRGGKYQKQRGVTLPRL
jgi:dCTP deaminase